MKKLLIAIGLLLSVDMCFSQKADSLHQVAKQFMRNGDYPNAIIVLDHALKLDPDNLELQKDQAFTFYLQKNYSNAVEYGRKLIARKDADEQCYQILGMALKAVDEKKEADKMYKQGIKKFPSSGELYNEYGEMLWVKKDPEAIRFGKKELKWIPIILPTIIMPAGTITILMIRFGAWFMAKFLLTWRVIADARLK